MLVFKKICYAIPADCYMKLSFIIKVFFYCFVSLILFLSGIFYSFFYKRPDIKDVFAQYPLTQIVFEHPWDKTSLTGKDILAGQKIKGQFSASANRLGTVAIKFDTHNRINSDQIIFRIKEKGEKNWFYEHIYRTDQIRREVFWPFGFSTISNSTNKVYKFEVESIKGRPGDTISVNTSEKSFITKYNYPKQYLEENKKEIPYFIVLKMVSILNQDSKAAPIISGIAILSLIIPFLIIKPILLIELSIAVSAKQLKKITTKVRKYNQINLLAALLRGSSFLGKLLNYLFTITIISLAILLSSFVQIIIRFVGFIVYILFKILAKIFQILAKIFQKIPFLIITSLVLLFVGTYAVFLDKQAFFEDKSFMYLSSLHHWETSTTDNGKYLAEQLRTVKRPLDEKSALLAGEKIHGQFVANYNNLGTVSIGIFDFYRENTDKIIFRLREVGETRWYYENIYDTTLMRSSIFWPFEFVPIASSRGKKYEFEIQSTKGQIGNAIALIPNESTKSSFFTKYHYGLSFFMSQPVEILPFIFAKVSLPFSRLDKASWIFLITLPLTPLIIYLLGLHKIDHLRFSVDGKKKNGILNFEINRTSFQIFNKDNYVELFCKIHIVLIIFLTFSIFLAVFFPVRTKAFDLRVYVLTSIMIPVIFFRLGVFFNKRPITQKIEKWIMWILVIIFGFILWYLFFNDLLSVTFPLFLLMAFIPILPIIKNEGTISNKQFSVLQIFGKIPKIFSNQIFLMNLLGIFAVTSFFFETMFRSPNIRTYFIKWLLLTGFISYLVFNYQVIFQSKLRDSIPLLKIFKNTFSTVFFRLSLLIFSAVILFLVVHREPINYLLYSHAAFYVGPALDILNGKSLLYDTPSQYGYFSIHFISLIQRIIGTTIVLFDRFNSFLLILFYGVFAGLISYKLTKSTLLSLLFGIFFVGFKSFFSDYHDFIFPSSGPLRFGFGILICFFLLYLPPRVSFLVSTILSAISIFWSPETGIFIVPAWLFTCGITAWKKYSLSRKFIQEVFIKTGLFLIAVLILAIGIIFLEYRPAGGGGLQNLYNYLQYTLTYITGSFSILTPMYGNHYFYLFISIVSLGVFCHLLTKKFDSWTFPALSFIVIHNLAIYSYFVYRSWYSLIIDLAGFLIIELVLLYYVLHETIKFNTKDLKAYFGIPIIIFCVLFILKSTYVGNPPLTKIVNYNYSLLTTKTSAGQPFLSAIAEEFNVDTKNIIVLSEYDTLYLTNSKAKNYLPLNPSVMTFVLSDWRKKYINLKIKSIPIGTVLIVDTNFPDPDPNVGKSLISIKNEIEKLYELSPVRTNDKILTKLINRESLEINPKNITIYKITAKKSPFVLIPN